MSSKDALHRSPLAAEILGHYNVPLLTGSYDIFVNAARQAEEVEAKEKAEGPEAEGPQADAGDESGDGSGGEEDAKEVMSKQ